jgi:hypothetical protein
VCGDSINCLSCSSGGTLSPPASATRELSSQLTSATAFIIAVRAQIGEGVLSPVPIICPHPPSLHRAVPASRVAVSAPSAPHCHNYPSNPPCLELSHLSHASQQLTSALPLHPPPPDSSLHLHATWVSRRPFSSRATALPPSRATLSLCCTLAGSRRRARRTARASSSTRLRSLAVGHSRHLLVSAALSRVRTVLLLPDLAA